MAKNRYSRLLKIGTCLNAILMLFPGSHIFALDSSTWSAQSAQAGVTSSHPPADAKASSISSGFFVANRAQLQKNLRNGLTILEARDREFAQGRRATISKNGIGGRGGSNAIMKANGAIPVLLDYFVFDVSYEDRQSPRLPRRLVVNNGALGAIAPVRKQPAYALLQDRLNAWEQSSPVIVMAVRASLEHMEYTPHFGSLPPQAGYSIPSEILETAPDARLLPVFAYDKSLGAAQVSVPGWEQVGAYSQAGAFLHESLRDIQLIREDGMQDSVIQWITAKIMLTEPMPGESLDRPVLFGEHVQDLIQRFYDGPKEASSLFCNEFKKSFGKQRSCQRLRHRFASACQMNHLDQLNQLVELYANLRLETLNCASDSGGAAKIISLEQGYGALRDAQWNRDSIQLDGSTRAYQQLKILSNRLQNSLRSPNEAK